MKRIPIIAYLPDGTVLHYRTMLEAQRDLHIRQSTLRFMLDTGYEYEANGTTSKKHLKGLVIDEEYTI